ncbi:hypothetical protein GTP91_03230 [Rugamonas sp. FT82W]|uniref:Uncharacterized protein n=1 Tax=Duganella vulcania TaxID=2692166 RepID=A0A845FZR1_9BURK|nr:hypothetical protein [Duganella vulcania]MYM86189.1 hypothetical protein [Duganella vulcania]
MVLFKSFLGKSLFVALFTLLFIGGYLIKYRVEQLPVDGEFLINILLTCSILLGCIGIQELSRTGKKWVALALGAILATLYMQKIMTLGPQVLTSAALAFFALLAYSLACAVRKF